MVMKKKPVLLLLALTALYELAESVDVGLGSSRTENTTFALAPPTEKDGEHGSAESRDLLEACSKECDENEECRREGEDEVCRCRKGFFRVGDVCLECVCGKNEVCTIDELTQAKNCTCEDGHHRVKGKCTDCEDEIAHCPPKFEKAVIGGKCVCACSIKKAGDDCLKGCMCGEEGTYTGCSINLEEVSVNCHCEKKFSQLNGVCKACDCGEDSVQCNFIGSKKTCRCRKGYADKDGRCENCECGVHSTGCRFRNGLKLCHCRAGYAQDEYCKECDCGEYGLTCEFDDGVKVCTCETGYSQQNDTCAEIQPCQSSPCKNGGTCYEGEGNDYHCNCPATHTGRNCQTVIDPCKPMPCLNGGTCRWNLPTNYSCLCRTGYTGRHCETLAHPCADNPCMNGGTCYRGKELDYVCKCPPTHTGKHCGKECDCGNATTWCRIIGYNKTCFCEEDYAERNGKCTECACGENSTGCFFRGLAKTCHCKTGFEDDNGWCELCECGDGSVKCEFVRGSKMCTCHPDFAVRNGTCKKCDCGKHAKNCNFGAEGSKFCQCEEGHVDYRGKCKECKPTTGCKGGACAFDAGGKAYCRCDEGYALYKGECKPCECGDGSVKCEFVRGSKMCTCHPDFAVKNSTCEKCDCGVHSKSCSFNTEGRKICGCKEGYADKQGICERCDCGNGSRCTFIVSGDKLCECEEGYVFKDGACEECDCGKHAKSCNFDAKGSKSCQCEEGYAEYKGKCKECKLTTGCKGGACAFDAGGRAYCRCDEGYALYKGECKFKEPCRDDLNPCQNGNCTVLEDFSYKCQCDEGFGGDQCEYIAWCREYGHFCPDDCTFSEQLKTGYCRCPEGKFFSYTHRKCMDIDECLFMNCSENQVCENGKCQCKRGYKESGSSCVFLSGCSETRCRINEDCTENPRDPFTPLCTCKRGFYYNGEACKRASCDVPGLSGCSQMCRPKDGADGGYVCACAKGFALRSDKKTCVLTDETYRCKAELKCRAGPSLKGHCVRLGEEDQCLCPPGYEPNSTKNGCTLREDICPGGRVDKDKGVCVCRGNLKIAQDGVTCKRARPCDDKANIEICADLNSFCEDDDTSEKGYSCRCKDGNAKDESQRCVGICDLRAARDKCSDEGKECHVTFDGMSYTSTCRCALGMQEENRTCGGFAKNTYIIYGLPISRLKYKGDPNTDSTFYPKLLYDIRESVMSNYWSVRENRKLRGQKYEISFHRKMKNVYPDVEDVALVSCRARKTELLCDIELRLLGDHKDDVARRFQLPNVCVRGETEHDFCVVPPRLPLRIRSIQGITSTEINFCTEVIMRQYCGSYAACSVTEHRQGRCFCPVGYKSVSERNVAGSIAVVCEDADECTDGSHSCSKTTRCVNTIGSYYCQCKPGFKKPTGKFEDKEPCIDLCEDSACGHGSCSKTSNFTTYCKCNPGYAGPFCDEVDVNFKNKESKIHWLTIVASLLGACLLAAIATLLLSLKRFKTCGSGCFEILTRRSRRRETMTNYTLH